MKKHTTGFGTKLNLKMGSELLILVCAEGFLLLTLILSLSGVLPDDDRANNAAICLLVSALLLMPWVFERCFSVKMPVMLKVMFLLLIIGGPILGKIYRFYYLIKPWDKILHTSSGFLFAVIGALIPEVLDRKNGTHSLAITLTCAMCFTLSVAVIWEFFEYAMDTFFGMDMQQDTWIANINSYQLGTEAGVIGRIPEISSVIVNGEEIAINGYLDIGLIDTMNDMLVCSLGGGIYCVCSVLYHHSVIALSWFKSIIPTACSTESTLCVQEDDAHNAK